MENSSVEKNHSIWLVGRVSQTMNSAPEHGSVASTAKPHRTWRRDSRCPPGPDESVPTRHPARSGIRVFVVSRNTGKQRRWWFRAKVGDDLVSHGTHNERQGLERTLPKCLMPEAVGRGDKVGLSEFDNAAAEIAPDAKINQAFGKICPAHGAPGKAHLSLVAEEERGDNTRDDTPGAPVIESVTV